MPPVTSNILPRQIHCVDKQCMSFIGEKCIDGADCYNNIDKTSFGTECIQSTCRVSTGNGCNRNEECAVESDLCIDRKCTSTKCDCKSYENCVDYTCTAKACSITPDCDNDDGGILDSFCYDNSCRPLASFGGKCGIPSDCGEADASCKVFVPPLKKRKRKMKTHMQEVKVKVKVVDPLLPVA